MLTMRFLHRFHAIGWTFPWAVVAVRGLNVCLRKIDYPLIWKLLKEQGITHFNAAPTVNTLLVAAKEAEKLPQEVRVTVAASPPSGHLFEQMVNTLKLEPCRNQLIVLIDQSQSHSGSCLRNDW
jgi:acyl-CoA synthetase (AMP-forming)/AMP-acid ligase II